MTVFVNGKYLAQPTTGVQRVATCLLQALDAGPPLPVGPWVLLHPPGVQPPALRQVQARAVGRPGLPLHAWEQGVLPWAARTGWLLNLAGAAPALARRQICLVHDAAVYDRSVTYTRRFTTYYRGLFHWLIWRSVPFLTVSEFSRQRLSHHLGLPAARIGLVRNGADHLHDVAADPAVIDRLGLHGVPFFLAVPGGSAGKNLARVLLAFRQLPAPSGCRLVVVGARHDAVFADSGADAPDPAGVLRVGRVTDAQLKALYGHATALVFPSLYEGFGLPAAEAMALGCPVIAADAAALPEVCGGAALLVDPQSVDAIAGAMRRLLTDAALAARLRQAGLLRAQSLRWRDSARQLLQAVEPRLARAGQP